MQLHNSFSPHCAGKTTRIPPLTKWQSHSGMEGRNFSFFWTAASEASLSYSGSYRGHVAFMVVAKKKSFCRRRNLHQINNLIKIKLMYFELWISVTSYRLLTCELNQINLQYNALVRWANGTNKTSIKHVPSIIFFHKIFAKTLSIYFFSFYKITKMEIKSFECCKSIKSFEKKNTWNFRRLVKESFVPSAKRTSVLYHRLTNFK